MFAHFRLKEKIIPPHVYILLQIPSRPKTLGYFPQFFLSVHEAPYMKETPRVRTKVTSSLNEVSTDLRRNF